MSLEVWAKLLNFVGALAALLPALHAGWFGLKARRLWPGPEIRGGMGEILKITSAYFDNLRIRFGPKHFALTVGGVFMLTAGFAIDFICAIGWPRDCT